MSKKILVTDSLFIFDEHIKQLEAAGYEVERLDKARATEAELTEAVKDKVGYILGGIEHVTDKVLEAASELKAIAFTGADYKALIPGWESAGEKGIAITTTPGANATAVAEFAMAAALIMQRNLLELGRTGSKKFETAKSMQNSVIGIIGAGNIGLKLAEMVNTFSPSEVIYFNRSKNEKIDAKYVEFDGLLQTADVIFVAVPGSAGQLFNAENLAKTKKGALIISISPTNLFDFEALLPKLQNNELRVAIDWSAPNEEFAKLPMNVWFNTNDHTGYNTFVANKIASDMAVESLLNVLRTGEDKYRVV